MKIPAAAAVAALLLAGASAHAASPGCNGDPWNTKCKAADFTNPVFASPQWYAKNPVARDSVLRDCQHPLPVPGWGPPPAQMCRAAAAAMGIRAPR